MTKFADKLCDKLHDKICRQSLSTAADEYLTFWFLCIFLVSATHTKTSRAYIQLAVEGFPFCRSPLQVLARVPASVCIARTHAITGGRVHAPDRCREIGRQTLRHAGTCAGKRACGRARRNRYQHHIGRMYLCTNHVLNIIDILSNQHNHSRSWPSEMNSSLQMQMNSSLRASVS